MAKTTCCMCNTLIPLNKSPISCESLLNTFVSVWKLPQTLINKLVNEDIPCCKKCLDKLDQISKLNDKLQNIQSDFIKLQNEIEQCIKKNNKFSKISDTLLKAIESNKDNIALSSESNESSPISPVNSPGNNNIDKDEDCDTGSPEQLPDRVGCPQCRLTFGDEIGRDAHFRKRHQGEQFPFECDQCKKRFKSRRLCSTHRMTHTKETPFICEHCGIGFRMSRLLSYHIANKHQDQDFTLKTKPYPCSLTSCSKSFVTSSKLRTHLLTHTKQFPPEQTCPICSKGFYTRSELRLHKVVKHDLSDHILKSLKCTECSRTFSCNSALKNHKKLVHLSDLKYKCDLCDYKGVSKSALQRHKLKHNKEKDFRCPICQNEFKHKRSLEKHLKGHEGNLVFICDVCGKKYIDKYKLNRHIRIHGSERPFPCNVCERRFYTKDALKSHKKWHEKKKPPRPEIEESPEILAEIEIGNLDESLGLPIQLIPSIDHNNANVTKTTNSESNMFQFEYHP